MKKYIKILIILVCFISTVSMVGEFKVYAMIPSLSFSSYYTGSDSVIVTISGDPNSLVTLYYSTSSGIQARSLGNTNSTGFFNTTLAIREYNVLPGGAVYVVVNGQQSASVSWPYYSTSSTIFFSQSTVSLSVGQYSSITAYTTGGSLYVSSSSNPSAASVSITGSTISIYGQGIGSSTITICQSPSSIFCGTIYIIVGGSYINPNYPTGLSLSSLMIPSGSVATIVGSPGVGLNISGNTNPAVVSVGTSSGSSVTISGVSTGSTTLTLCQTNTSACNSLSVTVTNTPIQQVPNQPTLPSPSCWFTRTLRYGMSGNDVYCLQSYLSNEGYLATENVTSYFDGETREAVISYQWNHGLKTDGVVGRATRYEILY